MHLESGSFLLQVVDQRDMNDYAMKQSEFFKAFRAGGDDLKGSADRLMLKVKDYPPEAAFAETMPRNWQVTAGTYRLAISFLILALPKKTLLSNCLLQ